MNRHERIKQQLGMPQGTAANKLRKALLFKYVEIAGDTVCHKCGGGINSPEELSIEHKEPWEGRSAELFWDLENIAFSHTKCNRPHKHGWLGKTDKRKHVEQGQAWCSKCQRALPTSEFASNSSRWNGLQAYCRSCCRAVRK